MRGRVMFDDLAARDAFEAALRATGWRTRRTVTRTVRFEHLGYKDPNNLCLGNNAITKRIYDKQYVVTFYA